MICGYFGVPHRKFDFYFGLALSTGNIVDFGNCNPSVYVACKGGICLEWHLEHLSSQLSSLKHIVVSSHVWCHRMTIQMSWPWLPGFLPEGWGLFCNQKMEIPGRRAGLAWNSLCGEGMDIFWNYTFQKQQWLVLTGTVEPSGFCTLARVNVTSASVAELNHL